MLLPKIHGHMDCLHVHQVLKLLHALVGHAGPPGNQFLIVLDFAWRPSQRISR